MSGNIPIRNNQLNIPNGHHVDIKYVNGKAVVFIKSGATSTLQPMIHKELQIPIHSEEHEDASKMAVDTVEESHRYHRIFHYRNMI